MLLNDAQGGHEDGRGELLRRVFNALVQDRLYGDVLARQTCLGAHDRLLEKRRLLERVVRLRRPPWIRLWLRVETQVFEVQADQVLDLSLSSSLASQARSSQKKGREETHCQPKESNIRQFVSLIASTDIRMSAREPDLYRL